MKPLRPEPNPHALPLPERPRLEAVSNAGTRRAQAAPSAEGRPVSPSLSCVLPCHNEAANLERLLPRLVEEVSALVDRWELILVDDGSRDRSEPLLARWAEVEGVRVIQLSRNFGKEAALSAGLQAAAGDLVLTLDADGQHEPALIPQLLAQWRAGADVAYAQRCDRRDESALKRAASHAFFRLLNAGDRFEVPDGAGDFRLMDRRVVDALLALPERNRFLKGLYAWVGFKAVAVPYSPAPRLQGRSRYNLPRLLRLSVDGLTAFTTWPLRAVGLLGFGMAAAAFAYGAYLSLSYLLYGHEVGGWTTIVVAMLLLSGLQLVSLGVLGAYLGRIFEEVKQRPLYVVRQQLGRGIEAPQ